MPLAKLLSAMAILFVPSFAVKRSAKTVWPMASDNAIRRDAFFGEEKMISKFPEVGLGNVIILPEVFSGRGDSPNILTYIESEQAGHPDASEIQT